MAKADLVKALADGSWKVTSLNSDNDYKVKVADKVHAYDLWCTCSAWRFKKGEKDCKHCEAVRQFDKGNNVPTKKVITKTRKSKQLKTEKKNPQLKKIGQLNEIADFWDSLNIDIQEQIINELNFDPSIFNRTTLRKTKEELIPFRDLSSKLQEKIVTDYKNYLADKGTISETLDSCMSDLDMEGLTNFKPSKKKLLKNVKVTCWHCGNKDQKIISEDKPFKCDKCQEDLWTGEGGFEEIKVGVWR